jgi:cytochrome P450
MSWLPHWKFIEVLQQVFHQRHILAFYWLDVRPAIRARKRRAGEDVISHLLSLNYSDPEILIECVTYAAAGMVTTREFISVAAWHFLEHPELRTRYLAAPEEERLEMLHETLRLEPVVTYLERCATADMAIESQGKQFIIREGEALKIHISSANEDEAVVGEEPRMLCPGREIHGERIPSMVMSFGDGHHRCPGAYIAMQETDIFLQRLLSLDNLRLEKSPALTWNDLTTGYEIRKFQIAVN